MHTFGRVTCIHTAICLLLAVPFAALARETPEIPLGIEVTPEDVNLRVYSGGCTSADDFELAVDKASPPRLTVTRLRPDVCRAYLPDGVVLKFSRASIGLAKGSGVVLVNALASPGRQGSVLHDALTTKKSSAAVDFSGQGMVRSLAGQMSFCMDGARYELVRTLGGVRLQVSEGSLSDALDRAVAGQYSVTVRGQWVDGAECRSVRVEDVQALGQDPAALDSRRWHAWINRMPPGPPTLHVVGEVMLPASGSAATLIAKSPQGINPRILLLDLVTTLGSGALVPTPVRYDVSAEGVAPGEVHIFRNGVVQVRLDVQQVE